ncbi:MAG: phosphatase PAP2 family protein [Candidatus Kapabacteria bacterium]|nr:phosphatase PAP2 family protein [Candidatus Kapabacteria bacterium]
MIDALYSVDVWLFYAVNHGLSNPVFDLLMPLVTTTKWWYPLYAVGIGYLLLRGWQQRSSSEGKNLIWCAALLLLAVAVLDQASHRLLKEVISRPRPYLVLGDVYQLVGSGGGSFPSNHAMNNSAAAVILSGFFPNKRWIFWTIATTITFSRVYCGVHYPSDVLGGAIIGAGAGFMFLASARRLMR